jgi:hypothetical protein
MPLFPKKETAITVLVRQMIAGYHKHAVDFPRISQGRLITRYLNYRTAKREQDTAFGQSHLTSEIKNASLKRLTEVMKACLRKSEVDVAENPEKLALIGWGPLKVPQLIEKPGQPDNLFSVNQGWNKVSLQWDSPAGGGAVRNYIIERRCQKVDGKFDSWKLIATAIQNRITLINQPQKSILEYRVKAVNISGESMPSNTIVVVL